MLNQFGGFPVSNIKIGVFIMNVGDLVEFEDWASDDATVVAQVHLIFPHETTKVVVRFFDGGYESKPVNMLRKLSTEEAVLWKLENA
jgi:hypothetical protein